MFTISIKAVNSYSEIIKSSEYENIFASRRECSLIVSQGDFLFEAAVADWINADIVFANSTCFNAELMQLIAEKAVLMRSGSRFITFTSRLPSDAFSLLEKINLCMSWGTATCFIHVRYVNSTSLFHNHSHYSISTYKLFTALQVIVVAPVLLIATLLCGYNTLQTS